MDEMNQLENYIDLQKKIDILDEELRPLEEKRKKLSDQMKRNSYDLHPGERNFIAHKLWENYSDNQKESVREARKKMEEMRDTVSFSISGTLSNVLDPTNDPWEILGYEEQGDNIRFKVANPDRSCYIEGYFIPDLYQTVWFPKEELKDIMAYNNQRI